MGLLTTARPARAGSNFPGIKDENRRERERLCAQDRVVFVYCCCVYIKWVKQFLDMFVLGQIFHLGVSGCKRIFSFSRPWKYVERRGTGWK